MLPNPRVVVFVRFYLVFSTFFIDTSDGFSVVVGHGVLANRTTSHSTDLFKQDSKNYNNQKETNIDLKKMTKNPSEIMFHPIPLKFHTQRPHVPKINPTPNQLSTNNQTKSTSIVPVNERKASKPKETKTNNHLPPTEKFAFDFLNNNSKGKKSKKDDRTFIQKILPLMVTPFLISSGLVPMMLVALLHMLVKGAFIGKIGLILMLINMFTNRRNPGAVSHHEIDSGYAGNQVAMEHYGWLGDEEYGAYVNRKRKR